MTQGTLLIGHSLYNTLQKNRAARRRTSKRPKPFNFFFTATAPQWARASSFTRFLDHIQRRNTQSIRLLWTSDQLVAKTSTWQHTTNTTDIHGPRGIRTHNLSRRGATNLWLRQHGNWDRQNHIL